MNVFLRYLTPVVAAVALVSASRAVPVHAQRPPPPGRALRPPPPGGPDVTPIEIQRMFEAVALVRAQEALKLSDDRYLPFLAKYKALQEARRWALQQRGALLRELRRLTNEAGDEAAIREQLKALANLDVRSGGEVHKAYEGIDEVLDVQQQARFRLFEEAMERQKIEILMRARQANRPNRR